MQTECIIEDCPFPADRRGWCVMHYTRWNRHGDTSVTLRASVPAGTTIENRFWAKVDKSGECWPWTAAVFKNRNGYGKFQAGTSRTDRREVYAHRYSWELANGPVPEGFWVLHHCDNPPCVRPDHLWLGTNKDNHDDMVRKGRARHWGHDR